MLQKAISALVFVSSIAGSAPAQDADWSWRKPIPAGQAIEIKGVIGDITATPVTGNEVEVRATKRSRQSDTSSVRIEVVEHARGVTICAIYDDDNECRAGAHGNSSSRENDTRVTFEVRVPRGVNFTARTVIGDVEASGLTANIDASCVTGDIRVSTAGLVEASTVSGSITARMGRNDWDDLDFRTVSGDITLELPADLNTEVSFSTVSGDVSSDWEIATRGTVGRKRFRGTIGRGGRELSFSTVSGNVELRKIN